ncbi:hypothetical protein FCH28_26380 [Streptomyces piniterrae]|uniref:WXG100 family type VII secretion target n=1 Tax=Streptomyces piniterrae TaxID=2571125 RepID=A0A4V5MKL7_9ACTN|nr:hypothetical protein [Streptomyces piniterrae]TJZ46058.1 hypothetical protein FCH28_26380 [Streptomyces piniterrae]
MAGSGYDVDPAVLKTQGGVFGDIGSGFSEAAKKLKAAVGGDPGEAWGKDDFVGTFNDFYGPVAEGICESMPHLGEELSKIGSKLEAMGAHYDATEQEQHDHLAKYAASRPEIAN